MHSSHNTSIKNWHLQIRGHCYWNQNLVLSEKYKVKKKKILKERDSQVCFDIRKETSLRKAIVLLTCFFLVFVLSKKYKYVCLSVYIQEAMWSFSRFEWDEQYLQSGPQTCSNQYCKYLLQP